MNLNQLKIFHVAAQLKSFTRAAEKLYLTQPGISKHIKQLEDSYGVKLFDRIGKKVNLTQAGEILLETTKAVFHQIDEAKLKIDDLRGLRGGKLVIGASVTVGVYLLPKVLSHFMLKYPDISLSTDISLSREVEDKVLNNRNDIGIVGHHIKDDRLVTNRFITDELMVIVPCHHKWSKRKQIQPHDLTSQTFIVSREGSGTRKTIEEILNAKGIVLNNKMEFGNTEGVKKAVEAGLGISILSKYVVAREVSLELLCAIPLSGINTKRDINIIYLKEKYLSRLTKAFLDFLKEREVLSPPE
jgi:DNA-binding transcriptional LysR family regulator